MINIFKKEAKPLIAEKVVGLNEVVSSLETAFPRIDIRPGVSHDEIIYNAGERAVIEWLKRRLDKEG